MTRAQALQATALVALHDAFPGVDELEPARVDWIVYMLPGVTRAQVERMCRSHSVQTSAREQKRLQRLATDARVEAGEGGDLVWDWFGGDEYEEAAE